MNPQQRANRRIASSSALLAAIFRCPGKDEEFVLEERGGPYKLPIKRESQLADDFAFLAATSDDPEKVMAVAVEEDSERQGLTLRLACNSSIPDAVKSGLQQIASIVHQAASRGRSAPKGAQ